MAGTVLDIPRKLTPRGGRHRKAGRRALRSRTHPAVPRELEREIWYGLRAAAAVEGIPVARLMCMIDGARCALPRERALRLFAIGYFHALRAVRRSCRQRSPWMARARSLTAGLDAVARGRL